MYTTYLDHYQLQCLQGCMYLGENLFGKYASTVINTKTLFVFEEGNTIVIGVDAFLKVVDRE